MRAEIDAQESVHQVGPESSPGVRQPRFPLWLKFGFWACTAIAVAVVLRRAVALDRKSVV